MVITVCVGSSCHLKGSYDIIKRLEKLIKENNLEDQVELKASFCLGHCTEGVSTTVDGGIVNSLTIDSVEEFFKEKILGRFTT